MQYFAGLTFIAAVHLPRCPAWIDREFPDFWALNFARAGYLLHAVNGAPLRRWQAPVAWWTRPGQHYQYGVRPGDTWDHYYTTFRGPRVAQWVRGGLLPARGPGILAIHQPVPLTTSFEALVHSLALRPVANARAVALLEDLLLQLSEQVPAPASEPPLAGHLRRLAQRLSDQPAAGCEVQQEAARLGISVVHLRRCFRQLTGMPPQQFASRAAMDQAARLLSSTQLPIKALAAQVGYNDVYHFGKCFKRRHGLPPAAYRAQWQGPATGRAAKS